MVYSTINKTSPYRVSNDTTSFTITVSNASTEERISFSSQHSQWNGNITNIEAVNTTTSMVTLQVTMNANTGYTDATSMCQIAISHHTMSGAYIADEDFDLTVIQDASIEDVSSDIGWVVNLSDKDTKTFSAVISFGDNDTLSFDEATDGVQSVSEVGGQQGEVMFQIVMKPNTTSDVREDVITFEKDSSGRLSLYYMYVFTAPNIEYNRPIWKDTDFKYGISDESFEYVIKVKDGETIYSGIAYKIGDAMSAIVRINEICEDYLSQIADIESDAIVQQKDYHKTFELYAIKGASEVYAATFDFINDWSYTTPEYGYELVKTISEPIVTSLPSGAYVPVSFYCKYDGTTSSQFNSEDVYEYDASGNLLNVTSYTVRTNGYKWDIWFKPNTAGLYKVSCGSVGTGRVSYTFDNCTANYVLYYRNSRGGYDALAVKGKESQKDDISSSFITKRHNNTKIEYGKYTYQKDIRENWAFNTGYMTDSESVRIKELIESPEVYVHNIETGEIIPVYTTNGELTYKTFRNQRTMKLYHVINVENTRMKYRK